MPRRKLADLEKVIQTTIERLDAIGPCAQTSAYCEAKTRIMRLAQNLREVMDSPGPFKVSKLKAPKARVSLLCGAKPSRDLTAEESGHLTKLVYDLETESFLEPDHEENGLDVSATWDFSSPLRSVTAGRGVVTVVYDHRVIWKMDTTGVEAYIRYCLRQEIVSCYCPWKH